MGAISYLWHKSVDTIREYGIGVFLKKTVLYLKKKKDLKRFGSSAATKPAPDQVFMDVLFINGCYLPHPYRYRVAHQREQLLANGVMSNEIMYDALSLNMIKHYRMFVFFRCPHTDIIERFIRIAKEHHKTVLFDVDDLVIDTKYTNQINYVKKMAWEERENYDSGVERMKRTLLLCDGAITTTERLAEELRHYVPEVFINRNVASERMLQLSEKAVYNRDVLPYKTEAELDKEEQTLRKKTVGYRAPGIIRIGYFSGSITHNSDVEMILPALTAIMRRYTNVELHFVGEMDIPDELKEFKDRIFAKEFVPWEELPELIASVDINIAPLEDTVFNEAKSENKWIEAALVKVPTVASRIGAFAKMLENEKTGLLCEDNGDWEKYLGLLIEDEAYRKRLAENAYRYVRKHACTIETGYPLAEYLRSKMKPNLVMCLPSLQISGGVLVAIRHCAMLSKAGVDVTIFNEGVEQKDVVFEGQVIFVLSRQQTQVHGRIDKAVATLWSTVSPLILYPNIGRRYYLVQGYEVDFLKPGQYLRILANQSYIPPVQFQHITVSKWCVKWLKEKYHKNARYAPNGIELRNFPVRKRSFSDKIRILVEGNSDDYYKNVDESFWIVDKLDKNRFETWFMSYQGKAKKWYRVDKELYKIPNSEVGKVYEQCDILIKSSLHESFSYPPLEMMATGGYCVVAPNDGNAEYLVDEKNCLLYEQGNIESAIKAIERICKDEELRQTLFEEGLKTAKSRDWAGLTDEILALYE